jgi:5-methylcytosine-specific restriction protein A
MSTFLFTWNPSKWHWSDLPEAVVKVNTNEDYDIYWSCGNTKKISIGDTFLLMRLGVPPKGIIGLGQVLSKPYYLPHWDEEKAKDGKMALRVDLLFRQLSESPLVDETTLKTDKETKQFDWFPQALGVLVPQNIAARILKMIEQQSESKFVPLSPESLATISEGKTIRITITTYDRSPLARQQCIDHYGTSCVICGFNFEVKYGQIGKGFIHVHHIKQVADVGEEHEINPIKDLRPVCANCHAVLHKRRPAYGIEDIKIHT